MVKAKKNKQNTPEDKLNYGHLHRLYGHKRLLKILLLVPFLLSLLMVVFLVSAYLHYDNIYSDRIYPGVTIDSLPFGGKTREDVIRHFEAKSAVFTDASIIMSYEDKTATISAVELEASYDGRLSADQAFSLGRSGNFLSDLYQKWQAASLGTNLDSVFRFNPQILEENLDYFASLVNRPAQDATFKFEEGKVLLFTPSKSGLALNRDKTTSMILAYFEEIDRGSSPPVAYRLKLPVEKLEPAVTTENSNDFGIKELVGVGTSRFTGSIPGRVHNVELAASRFNGRLIAPDEIFSFNEALGDVSAATGFQAAYIIKDGRTVLGDGGGVCQVSTTLFRAALAAGLPIEERHAHSYRVSYYEQDSGPGIDATVFAPSVDLKFKNDTGNYLLIQAKTDKANYGLTFELYGTADGRVAEVGKPIILSQAAPPDDLYIDDPTLNNGVVKQVDWKAWGAKTSFTYRVTRNNETLIEKTFFSSFQPWQAVFMRGTKV
ncbi:MAG: VanW family protein [Candidatus Gottesmanbacteria bacterium GW2011_GWA2_43_14]|uniref:VanW family protein n=1 Tax=Candidatus Gottesmanbacteria bacterium GW2011_GWA2_43_14 TaxID=1618443 RepID=A0A0G1DKV7_9BACT|nr:MAG: VanW family protein [Candidatus Gottesmanbacteria bacterium GW2011_GWA2_43_14]